MTATVDQANVRVQTKGADRLVVGFVFVLFFSSGFAALVYQVIWQRILAIFSGADVYAVTIIVGAFMAGLGCGSLVGGMLADRLSTGRGIVLFALSEFAIALFGWASIGIYYDGLYRQAGDLAASPLMLTFVLFISLLWPTFFMGMSLPLLAKTLTRRIETAAGTIGLLYAVNTLGAAVGAWLTTWVFIRAFGFVGSVQLGALLNITAALGAAATIPYFLRRAQRDQQIEGGTGQDSPAQLVEDSAPAQGATRQPVFRFGHWLLIYGVSGFIALALEIIWFRVIGVMIKSTAFTFGTLLAIYLTGLAIGTFWGIRGAQHADHSARPFLARQASIGLYAVLSLTLFVLLLGPNGILSPIWVYLENYEPVTAEQLLAVMNGASAGPDTMARVLAFVILNLLLPIIFIGPPTLLMGSSFPYLQRVVQQNAAYLGRRVGWLQTANIIGSLCGSVLTGWVFLRFLGTGLTLKLLVGGVVLFGFLLVRTWPTRRRVAAGVGGLLAAVALVALVPDSDMLWAKLHGTPPGLAISAEDGAGVSLLKQDPQTFDGQAVETVVYVNGIGQSYVPFGSIHTLLGMLPAMLHPAPREIAVIGLGSGDTSFAAGGRTETRQITVIEIIAAELTTLQHYQAVHPDGGVGSLLNDERMHFVFADGRTYLRLGAKKYDIIEADALRPTSAYAGNLYSIEYFAEIRDRLNTGGLAVEWTPTPRSSAGFARVFPYTLVFDHISVGSNDPIPWNAETIRARLTDGAVRAYYQRAGIDINRYMPLLTAPPTQRFAPGDDRSGLGEINSDLFPRDEYLVPDP